MSIPIAIRQLVEKKKFDVTHLSKFDFTVIVRAAHHYLNKGNCIIRDVLLEKWDINPLPIVDNISLFPHQVEVINFMRSCEEHDPDSNYGIKGGIIANAPGLGKMVTAISYSLLTPQLSMKKSPTLIITSKSMMTKWKVNGFEKFFSSDVKVLYLQHDFTPKSVIAKLHTHMLSDYDFVVVTYDACKTAHKKSKKIENAKMVDGVLDDGQAATFGIFLIHKYEWERVLCDESQILANSETNLYKSVVSIRARRGRWCLSGSVMRNSSGDVSSDVWSQLCFCGFNHHRARTADAWVANRDIILQEYDVMKKFVSHVNVSAVNDNLYGGCTTIRTDVMMTSPMKYLYDLLVNEAISSVRQIDMGVGATLATVALLGKLRQMLIAPYLLHPSSKHKKVRRVVNAPRDTRFAKSSFTLQKILGEWGEWIGDRDGKAGIYSPKMKFVCDVVKSIGDDDKIIIFSMFTNALDLVKYALVSVCGYTEFRETRNTPKHSAKRQTMSEKSIVQIDENVTGQQRNKIVESFKTDPNVRVLLMNYRVGSEGLDLTVSNKTILLEPCWIPTIMDQAIGRTHRVGQKREVTIYKPIMDCDVERNTLDISEPLTQKTMNRDITKRDIAVTISESTIRTLLSLQ